MSTKNNTTIQITKLGNKTAPSNKISGKRNNSKKKVTENEEPNRKETFHFLAGSILLVVSLLMLLSFSSYVFTGAEDQGLIEAHASENFSNYAGSIGAYCAHFWIDQCFGLSAFFIPIFLLAASMKLTKAYHIRLWKWFLHCSFLTIWFSVMASFFFDGLIADIPEWNFLNPGGRHGQFIVERLTQTAGTFGVFLIILLTALIYFIYLSKTTIIFVRKLLNPVDYIKSKMPHSSSQDDSNNANTSK